jgi:Mg/Co/Ni transporter MgtE
VTLGVPRTAALCRAPPPLPHSPARAEFDDLISAHVQLSFFVPLIMGHGGNAGAQTTCAVIRALALNQVSWKNAVVVVGKEAAAGALMGGILGTAVLALALLAAPTGHSVSPEVALTVAVAMPVISLWSNGLGAFLTLASAKLRMDPAMASAPLVTTIVDSTALIIYFVIAKVIISEGLLASLSAHSSIIAAMVSSSS